MIREAAIIQRNENSGWKKILTNILQLLLPTGRRRPGCRFFIPCSYSQGYLYPVSLSHRVWDNKKPASCNDPAGPEKQHAVFEAKMIRTEIFQPEASSPQYSGIP